jgi:molybdopterin-guanine dinucleotide biosynthesis protein
MKVIAIVGKKKAGKTTLTAALIKKFSRPSTYIYDINNEYTRKFNLKNDYTGPINTDKFLEAASKVKNSCIVFEEATSYFSSKGREAQLVDIISRSRHTNNVVILIFHSIADFPRYIYTFTDYIGLFKTNDFRSSLDQKLRKNEYFISIYDRVRYNTSQNYFEFFENVN